MNTAYKIILDELIENSHPELVENVILYALHQYASSNQGTMNGAIAYSISQRIFESEENTNPAIQNHETIEKFCELVDYA